MLRLCEAAALGCAPPRAEWTLVGERHVVLTPGRVTYNADPIEWVPAPGAQDATMLILEVEKPSLPGLTERGGDLAAFHRDLIAHAGLRFKSVSAVKADPEGAADYRLRLRNFRGDPQFLRVRLIGGLPLGTTVTMKIPGFDDHTEYTIYHRPQKLWIDATLPAGFDGFCDVSVVLPSRASGDHGFQLRTAYYHDELEHVVDGGARNVRIL